MNNTKILNKAVRSILCKCISILILIFTGLILVQASPGRRIDKNQVLRLTRAACKSVYNPPAGYQTSTLSIVTLQCANSFSNNNRYDSVPFTISTRDQNNNSRNYIHGILTVTGKQITFSISDSLLLNYKRWTVSPGNKISFTPQGILVSDFLLSNDSSRISLSGQPGVANNPIDITVENLNLRDIAGLKDNDTLFASGLLDAKLLLSGFKKNLPALTGTASIKNLALRQQPVGNVLLDSRKVDENTVHATLNLTGNNNNVTIEGNYLLTNDRVHEFDAIMNIKNLQLASLQGLVKSLIGQAVGSTSGVIALNGKLARPQWKGKLNIDTAGFVVSQWGTTYTINNQQVSLDYPVITFNQFTIKDSLDQPFVINGKMSSNKKLYDLDIDLTTKNFSLINAPKAINNQFYGYAVIDAGVALKGTSDTPQISGKINLTEKTGLTLILPEKNIDKDEARSVVRFIDRDSFVFPDRGTFRPAVEPKVNFTPFLNQELSILTNKRQALTIIIDPSTGDQLKVYGDGKLHTGNDLSGRMIIAGDYILDSGYYELNYEFSKKRFNIIPGSKIIFGGAPGEARINIRALYIANTSPKDLLGNEVGSVSPRIARTFTKKVPFDVILSLKGSLGNPEISFDIQLPAQDEMSRELRTTIENKLAQLKSDIASTNKQVFALLALDRFVGEQSTDFFKGNSSGSGFSDIARESVSKFLSAALDQIASDLFTGINVDLNLNSFKDFTTSEGSQKTDLNVQVSKSFLNDRLTVTVGKNFGIESQDGSAKAAQQKGSRFLPDVTVTNKLSADGKYLLRSYTKNQFEVIIDGYVMETGVAFIATMDFDVFNELFINKNKKTKQ